MKSTAGQVVDVARKGGREPQRPAVGVRDDLRVHSVAAVPPGPSVADPAALAGSTVEQDDARFVRGVFRVPGACSAGRWMTVTVQVWVVESPLPNPAAIFARVVCSRGCTSAPRVLRRTELAASATFTGGDEHGGLFHARMEQAECGGAGNGRGLRAA